MKPKKHKTISNQSLDIDPHIAAMLLPAIDEMVNGHKMILNGTRSIFHILKENDILDEHALEVIHILNRRASEKANALVAHGAVENETEEEVSHENETGENSD